MKLISALEFTVTAVALLKGGAHATAVLAGAEPVLSRRALSNSPSGGYAPGVVSCPSQPLVRSARNISDGEAAFLEKRHAVTDAALRDLLGRAGMTGFDYNAFIDSYSPTVALAFSGGGYRAMLSGAGAVKAMDSRSPDSTGSGQLGGLLQSAKYFAGLSGGSWLLGALILNNFTTIDALQSSEEVWDLEDSILAPDSLSYYSDLRDEVNSKADAGFETTLTDYWGRALSRQFLNWTDGGPGVTFSSIALTDGYKNAEHPFPIVVADERHPGELIISLNATVFEFNPLEMGSWDPTLYSFTPLETLGTNMTNGRPNQDNVCVRGFDNAGYIMGTSSSLFNQFLLNLESSGLDGAILKLAQEILSDFSEAEYDIADYTPNPFYGVNTDTNPSGDIRNLTLVDGGSDLQNLPLVPLIQPLRNVDVIFAFDNSADTLNDDATTSNWPNGTAMVATYERSMRSDIANGTLFPHVPDTNTFVNLGLNRRPTFFGCSGQNITAGRTDASVPPLIVYMPNTPYSYRSNVSTFTLSYEDSERDDIITNGWNVVTQGNSTVASANDWPACVGCAIVHRQLERTGVAQSDQCRQCFTNYCWNGTLAPEDPPQYDPAMLLSSGARRLSSSAGDGGMVVLAAAVAVWALM